MSNNYILLGLKRKEAHGSFYGAEGFGGISMEGTEVSVLKSGTMGELQAYVTTQRKLAKDATKELEDLQDRLDREDETLSEEEYYSQHSECTEKRRILKYDTLIAVQGIVL